MPSLLSGSLIVTAFAAISAATPGDEATRPIRLVTEPTDQGLLVRVIGQSPTDVKLRYRLQVGAAEGGNRVSQGGAANLVGGDEPRTLATIRISGAALSGRLLVEYESGGGYEEKLGPTAE